MAYYRSSSRETCMRKRAYSKKKAAKQAAKRTQCVVGGRKLYVYRCPVCRLWHLGHKWRIRNEAA